MTHVRENGLLHVRRRAVELPQALIIEPAAGELSSTIDIILEHHLHNFSNERITTVARLETRRFPAETDPQSSPQGVSMIIREMDAFSGHSSESSPGSEAH